jgi:uncharacterized protein with PIN domain
MSNQHVQTNDRVAVCVECNLPLLASPRTEICGLGYFGHRALYCGKCGKISVVPSSAGE